MKTSLFDDVQQLSINMVNASANEDESTFFSAYESLKSLCLENEGGELDHPLQWEALGDFSDTHDERLTAYEKGLLCSQQLEFPDYSASLKFAIAESFMQEGNTAEAIGWAEHAQREVGESSCELGVAIREFLDEH